MISHQYFKFSDYKGTITERTFQGASARGPLQIHQYPLDVDLLNRKKIKEANSCKKWISFREEVTISIEMTEKISSHYVFLAMLTTIGNKNELVEVMSLSTCSNKPACHYIECEFGVKENFDGFTWFRYKCPKSSNYLIKTSLLVKHTLVSSLCIIAIFDE